MSSDHEQVTVDVVSENDDGSNDSNIDSISVDEAASLAGGDVAGDQGLGGFLAVPPISPDDLAHYTTAGNDTTDGDITTNSNFTTKYTFPSNDIDTDIDIYHCQKRSKYGLDRSLAIVNTVSNHCNVTNVNNANDTNCNENGKILGLQAINISHIIMVGPSTGLKDGQMIVELSKDILSGYLALHLYGIWSDFNCYQKFIYWCFMLLTVFTQYYAIFGSHFASCLTLLINNDDNNNKLEINYESVNSVIFRLFVVVAVIVCCLRSACGLYAVVQLENLVYFKNTRCLGMDNFIRNVKIYQYSTVIHVVLACIVLVWTSKDTNDAIINGCVLVFATRFGYWMYNIAKYMFKPLKNELLRLKFEIDDKRVGRLEQNADQWQDHSVCCSNFGCQASRDSDSDNDWNALVYALRSVLIGASAGMIIVLVIYF